MFEDRRDIDVMVWSEGPLFVVRWFAMLNSPTGDFVKASFLQASMGKSSQSHMHYIAVQPATLMGLSQEESKLSVEFANSILDQAKTFQLIILGEGLGEILLRSSFQALITASRVSKSLFDISTQGKIGRVFLPKNIAEALIRVSSIDKIDIPKTLHTLYDHGML